MSIYSTPTYLPKSYTIKCYCPRGRLECSQDIYFSCLESYSVIPCLMFSLWPLHTRAPKGTLSPQKFMNFQRFSKRSLASIYTRTYKILPCAATSRIPGIRQYLGIWGNPRQSKFEPSKGLAQHPHSSPLTCIRCVSRNLPIFGWIDFRGPF